MGHIPLGLHCLLLCFVLFVVLEFYIYVLCSFNQKAIIILTILVIIIIVIIISTKKKATASIYTDYIHTPGLCK